MTSEQGEYHDDQTLDKVRFGLVDAGFSFTESDDAIRVLLNKGILFRERRPSTHVTGPREVKPPSPEPEETTPALVGGSPHCAKCTFEHNGMPHFFHDTSEHTSWIAQMNSRAGD